MISQKLASTPAMRWQSLDHSVRPVFHGTSLLECRYSRKND